MTAALIAFLAARLDDDEAQANEVHQPRHCGSVDRDGDFDPDPVYCGCGRPDRERCEVSAWRTILAEADRIAQSASAYPNQGNIAALIAMQAVLKIKATVYSDHPDYRQEWKPA